MTFSALTLTALLGLATASAPPAQSPWPGHTPPATSLDRLVGTLSSNNPLEGCAKRGKDCTFKPCCDDRTCRANGDGEQWCR